MSTFFDRYRLWVFNHTIYAIKTTNSSNPLFIKVLRVSPIITHSYARDASRKQKAVYQSKGNSGKRTTNGVIYGYLKDKNDRTKWVVDPEAAEVVKRIFNMSVNGMGPFQIARTLTEEKVESPGYYHAKLGIGTRKNDVFKSPCLWSCTTVSGILEKHEYMGHTVNFRYEKESFKSKKQIKRSPNDWVIHENTHEAIIDAY